MAEYSTSDRIANNNLVIAILALIATVIFGLASFFQEEIRSASGLEASKVETASAGSASNPGTTSPREPRPASAVGARGAQHAEAGRLGLLLPRRTTASVDQGKSERIPPGRRLDEADRPVGPSSRDNHPRTAARVRTASFPLSERATSPTSGADDRGFSSKASPYRTVDSSGTTSQQRRREPRPSATDSLARVLCSGRWREHGSTIEGRPVFQSFLTDGNLRTFAGVDDQHPFIAGNVRWTRAGDTVYVTVYDHEGSDVVEWLCEGIISENQIFGSETNQKTGRTSEWRLTKVIE
jgi:hypothetical protein